MHWAKYVLRRGSWLLVCASLVSLGAVSAWTQNGTGMPKEEEEDFVRRCSPKIVKEGSVRQEAIRIRDAEKATAYSPLVKFEITETGEVIHVH